MYIQQLYTNCLAQAAYYVESNGEALIIDPLRDIDPYIQLAESRNAKIRFVLETHFHADFVSGHLELARKTGAVIVYGPGAQPDYAAAILKDHDVIDLGKIKIMLLHTPGHTIESSCYLLFNETNQVHCIFTGDTLFIGDVGRPDLMSGNLDKEVLAGMLYESLNKKIKVLPDATIVYPGHGAGSACGRNLGTETSSTIGIQKAVNYALQLGDKEEFIRQVCADQPAAPSYFFKDASINIHGYEMLDTIYKSADKPLTSGELILECGMGALVLDTRPAIDFGTGFIKGSVNIGLDGEFAVWVGTLIDFAQPLILLTEPGREKETITRLARIGYENILGYLKGGIAQWTLDGNRTEQIENINTSQLAAYMDTGKYALLDVRRPAEVERNRIFESHHIPLSELQSQIDLLDKENKYIIYCAGGYRSMMAASIMKREGFDVMNVIGGISQVLKDNPQLVESGQYA
jgi:glyoxylase-like metal-dependent hydrolase (beta-lactamase superfamily II)/rhodanese-related sulfurtransferase